MQYSIVCAKTLRAASLGQAWAVWSDLAAYPSWDEREEVNQPNGPLVAGMTGTFKQRGRGQGTYRVTAVEPGRRWITETSLPGGKLVIDHRLEATPAGVELTKQYTAHGPMALAFKLFFARNIRREMPGSFAALEAEIARRAAQGVQ